MLSTAWLKLLGVAAVLLALIYGWAGNLKEKQVASHRLVADLRSGDPGIRARAAASVAFLADQDPKFLPQLKTAGLPQALLRAVQLVDLAEQDTRDEVLPASLSALARLTRGDEAMQRLVATDADGALLPTLLDIIQTGIPLWQVAAAQLLHVVHMAAAPDDLAAAVAQAPEPLVAAAVDMLEKGAVSNSSEAIVSGVQLLEVLAALPATTPLVADPQLIRTLLQVVLTYTNDTNVTGAALGTLSSVLDAVVMGDDSKGAGLRAQLLEGGLIPRLLAEMRGGSEASGGPALALAARLAVQEPAAADELVQGGLLSTCAQMVVSSRPSLTRWQGLCLGLVALVTGSPQPPNGLPHSRWVHALVTMLVHVLKRVQSQPLEPGLHDAALEALRDVGRSKAAMDAVMELGGLQPVLALLQYNFTAMDFRDKAWLVQSQRSAAALVALMGLQPHLRVPVVEAGALDALAAAMRSHRDMPGLQAQVRTTAAVAMVPLLGTDRRFNGAAIASGALEDLLRMHYARKEAEREAADRLLRTLAAEGPVAEMLAEANIRL